jgi:hypothetical protein
MLKRRGFMRPFAREVEQATEPFTAADTAVEGCREARWKRDCVPQALVVALGVVVLDKFADGAAQMTLAERNDVPEALLPDRANKPFRVRVQIRAARR